jgi:hypothetical protein
LALANIEVITGRLEVLVVRIPEKLSCDGFVARAMKLGPTLDFRNIVSGGHAILWKGSDSGRSWPRPRRLAAELDHSDRPQDRMDRINLRIQRTP